MLSIDLLDKTTILEYPDILMSVYNHNIKVYIHVIFFYCFEKQYVPFFITIMYIQRFLPPVSIIP